MMKTILAMAIVIAGCSTSGSFEKDKRDQTYQSGEYGRPFVSSPSAQTGVRDESSSAATGILVGGVAAAINPDYYKDSRLRGRCSCRVATAENVRLNCPRSTIVLFDGAGREVARQQSADGQFAFDVDKKGIYRVRAEVPGHRALPGKSDRVKSGDEVILEFVKK